jgi:hypothetical protein
MLVGINGVPPWAKSNVIVNDLSVVVGTFVKFGTKFALMLEWYQISLADQSCVTVPVAPDMVASFSVICASVVVPVAVSVVKVPAAAADPPIAGGLAKYVLNPVPLTVELADNVVNAPVDAVVAPILVLLIVLAAAGLIVKAPVGLIATVPVPLGLIVTVVFAGLRVTVELALSVVALTGPPPPPPTDAQFVPSEYKNEEVRLVSA